MPYALQYTPEESDAVIQKMAKHLKNLKVRSLNQVNRYKKPGKEKTNIQIEHEAEQHVESIIRGI